MIPEQGQLVQVRHRTWIVEDIVAHDADNGVETSHRVTLECLDDDRMGEQLDLVWELEPHTEVHDALGFPRTEEWDSARRFDAFLNAVRWSAGSVVEGPPLHAPFRGAIEIEEYQLEPVVRALQMLSEALHEELDGMERAKGAFAAYEDIAVELIEALVSNLPETEGNQAPE